MLYKSGAQTKNSEHLPTERHRHPPVLTRNNGYSFFIFFFPYLFTYPVRLFILHHEPYPVQQLSGNLDDSLIAIHPPDNRFITQ